MQRAPGRPKTIALVDDHPIVLSGLADVLEGMGGYEVVVSATSGAAFIEGMRKAGPVDLAIVDLSMPEMDGFEVLRWLSAERPGTRATAFSYSDEKEWVRRAMQAGACGYILKDTGHREIRMVLEEVARTGQYHSALVLQSLSNSVDSTAGPGPLNIPARELEYLGYICGPGDLTYDQIAERMHVTRHMVDGYFRYFSKRFGVHSRAALVLFATEHKLEGLPPLSAN